MVPKKFKSTIKSSNFKYGIQQVKKIFDLSLRLILEGMLRRAIGGLLVFDLTNETSFNNLSLWLEEASFNSSDSAQFIIVGNKTDLPEYFK